MTNVNNFLLDNNMYENKHVGDNKIWEIDTDILHSILKTVTGKLCHLKFLHALICKLCVM